MSKYRFFLSEFFAPAPPHLFYGHYVGVLCMRKCTDLQRGLRVTAEWGSTSILGTDNAPQQLLPRPFYCGGSMHCLILQMLLLLSRKSSLQFSTFSSRPIYTTMSLLLLLLIHCNTDSLHTIVYVYHPTVLLLLLFFVVKLRLHLFCPIFQLSTITCVRKCCDYMLHAKHCCSL